MADRPVELSPRALRDLRKLPAEAAGEILGDLEILKKAAWPGPPKVKKLRGRDLYRLRTRDDRSIFEIRNGKVVILRIVGRQDMERILRTL
ncbi:MAG: type II toxin-antitoxin system RelE/ParE family toxin [Candidatus Rokubacteria bacterium]|nr:type II toxin-antitoxin system RelE/ParE family toxin [Candidatus Rokubacteria bacterium]